MAVAGAVTEIFLLQTLTVSSKAVAAFIRNAKGVAAAVPEVEPCWSRSQTGGTWPGQSGRRSGVRARTCTITMSIMFSTSNVDPHWM